MGSGSAQLWRTAPGGSCQGSEASTGAGAQTGRPGSNPQSFLGSAPRHYLGKPLVSRSRSPACALSWSLPGDGVERAERGPRHSGIRPSRAPVGRADTGTLEHWNNFQAEQINPSPNVLLPQTFSFPKRSPCLGLSQATVSNALNAARDTPVSDRVARRLVERILEHWNNFQAEQINPSPDAPPQMHQSGKTSRPTLPVLSVSPRCPESL